MNKYYDTNILRALFNQVIVNEQKTVKNKKINVAGEKYAEERNELRFCT